MNILFLVPYPTHEAPSQRFRFEQYFQLLTEKGYRYDVQPFLNAHHWKIFYSPGGFSRKVMALLTGLFRRIILLFSLGSYDFVFIHREAAPVGPPIIEWIIARIFRKKVIYDFDDAIWLTDKKEESAFEKIIRWRSKVGSICRWSYKISAGNEYLAAYAGKYNTEVCVNPTTIDTDHLHNRKLYAPLSKLDNCIVIGWTGSHTTLKYLEELDPVLQAIEKKYPSVSFHFIADKAPSLNLSNTVFLKWSKENEIRDLLQFDIGIMPLPDDEWAKGKCGFKALQYMSLGIPCLASPVGVNTKIIQHGENGFLCSSAQAWINSFDALIGSEQLRRQLGQRGCETVDRYYSVSSNASNFLSLFE